MRLPLKTLALCCAQVGAISDPPNCSQPGFRDFVYCDPDAPVDDRILDLVGRLTPADYPALLHNENSGLPQWGVPPLTYGEALHGALAPCGPPGAPGSTGCATSFPTPLALAASLNRSLWAAVAAAVSTENRGLHNAGLQASVVWAPVLNLFRDPRWGRGLESPGEDPLVGSEYAAFFINGLQGGEDARYLKTPATAKQ